MTTLPFGNRGIQEEAGVNGADNGDAEDNENDNDGSDNDNYNPNDE